MSEIENQSQDTLEIKRIFDLIKDDVEHLKDKQPSEIDFKYIYEDLEHVTCLMLKKIFIYKNSKLFSYCLLAYSLELSKIVARGFWTGLYEEMNIKKEKRSYYYKILFNTLWDLLNSLSVETISVKTNHGSLKRLVVGTLKMKVESDPTFFNDATQFFINYYRKYRNEEIEKILKTSEIYEKYKDKDKEEQFVAITRKLTDTVDYIIKNSLLELEDENKLHNEIIDELGIDFKRYTRRHISTIVREVLNRYTPKQFKKILKNNHDTFAELPNGRAMNCSLLEIKDFPYGIYNISGEEYQVTPDIRVSIEEILDWKFEEIGKFRNFGYYKKKEKFEANKGVIKELIYKNERFYLWFGTIPIGEIILIDGNQDRREGFIWNPNLRIKYPTKENSMILAIELGKINCYYPKNARNELKIELNGQSYMKNLDADGFLSKRNLEFELDGINQEITLNAILNGKLIRKKIFKLEESMLFSASSREQLKGSYKNSTISKRRFGENKYYLFTSSPEKTITGNKDEKSIILNETGTLGSYKIFEVEWRSTDSFFLKNGIYEWKFERKRFIEWWFKNNENTFNSLKDIEIGFITNFNPNNTEETPYIRIRNKDYSPIMENILLENYNTESSVHGEYLCENTLDKDLYPGEYVLEIYFEDIINRKNFYIIPKVDITWPNILGDNLESSVIISSENKNLLDAKTNICKDIIEIPIYGHVYPVYQDRKKNLPIIYPENVNVKVAFAIGDGYKDDSSTFVIKKYNPSRKIYVFGFKLFERETFKPIYELNYYDIDKCILFAYTAPYKAVELKIDNTIISKKPADEFGNCIFENLKILKDYCKSSTTVISISSYGISKELEILWFPKIYSINAPESWSDNVINFELDFEGPEDNQIYVKLENETSTLNEIVINCSNCRECNKFSFNIPESMDSTILFLISYITSLNKKLLKSKSLYFFNEHQINISVDINNKLYQENLYNFLNKYMIPLAFLFLSDDNNYHIKLPTNSSQNEFIELLTYLNLEIKILLPNNHLKSTYHYLKDITKNDSCLFTLNETTNKDKLKKFIKQPDTEILINSGIGILSNELDDLNNFFPKKPPLIVVDVQELRENEKNMILDICKEGKVIFIERGY